MADELTEELFAHLKESIGRFETMLEHYGDHRLEEDVFRQLLADALYWFNSKRLSFADALIGALLDFRADMRVIHRNDRLEPISIGHLVERILTEFQMVAVTWSIDDVKDVRPHLTDHQCWEVLQAAKDEHDADTGITWTTLTYHADELYPRGRQLPNLSNTNDL